MTQEPSVTVTNTTPAAEPDADDQIVQPDHELIGKRVYGYFARKDMATLEITGKVVGAHLSHMMHGNRVQMITVACDDGQERTATRFNVSVLADEPVSGPYVPSQVGADLPEQGGMWEITDTREPFGSYYRVVRTSGGDPKYWTVFEDAAIHATELNRALAAETSIVEPEHELIGKRVRGTFSNGTDSDIEVTGTVTSAYLSGEIHGFRLPMFTVECDNGRRLFMSRGSVTAIPDESSPVENDAEATDPPADEFGVLTVSQIHHKYIQVAARGDYDRTLRDGLEQELRLRELDELAELLSTVSAANRSGGWHHPMERNRTLARVRELVTEHGKSTRLQPVPAPTTKDAEVKVEVARKTVSIYRVEFSNTPADELHADPVTIAAATEDELVASIANQFLDDDEPSTENLTADFDVLGGSPDFGSGPVDGLVSISADESVCAFTATRIDTFEIPKDIDLDNDDTLMGNRVVVHAHKPGKAYVGTVVAAGLDQSLDHGQKVYTAVVVVKCDDGEIRISPRRDAWSVPKDTATR